MPILGSLWKDKGISIETQFLRAWKMKVIKLCGRCAILMWSPGDGSGI